MTSSSKDVVSAPPVSTPSQYESEHVHEVYDAIASHFSSTRYKPWPVVASFLASLPSGSVGIDSGTGNGKYLPITGSPGKIWTIGLDRSRKLLEIARFAGGMERECILADALENCWRGGAFDYAISIATIHHFSTPSRRKAAIQVNDRNLLRCLSPCHGRGLIYVWASQQDSMSKRSIPPASKVDDSGDKLQGVDVFVPWVLSDKLSKIVTKTNDKPELPEDLSLGSSPVYNRYYHMFDAGELASLIRAAAQSLGIQELQVHRTSGNPDVDSLPENLGKTRYIEIVKDDWERSNYYVEFRLSVG